MIKKICNPICSKKYFTGLLLILMLAGFQSVRAQSGTEPSGQNILMPLRSDVGIIGLTANFRWLNDFTYKGGAMPASDGTTELEIELRNVRMMSQRAGVGFQILTSFFGGDGNFGVGSWGAGPVVRGYPLKMDQFQPYVQADALFGNNLALGDLADAQAGPDGFRVRLGLRGGLAFRFSNRLGLFIEAGPDWESSSFFKADARAWQVNVGIDVYRFN